MERTALDGGQFLQVIGPTAPMGQQWNGAPMLPGDGLS